MGRKSVAARLRALGKLRESRAALYGDDYKHFGKIVKALFPGGVRLKTAEEINRFGLLLRIVSKTSRYARSFERGGHEDSLDDISVYAQLLAEYDDEVR